MKTTDTSKDILQEAGKATALIGRDEMNLAEFALGLASDRNPKGLKTVERCQVIPMKDGRMLEQQWIVTGSDKFGLPRAGDDDVLLGLLKLAADQQFASHKVYFSRYELISLLNWPLNGKSYDRLQEALDRLSGVRIVAKNSFWDNEKKSYISLNFGIVDEYQILENRRGQRAVEQMNMPFTYVSFSDKLFKSIQAKNIKRLDLNFYYSLNSSVSKRLYRFLTKRQRARHTFEIELMALASVNVGLDLGQRKYVSQIKQNLDNGHQELVDRSFLKEWSYRWSESREAWFVQYTFTDSQQNDEQPSIEIEAPALALPPSEIELVNQLVKRGFSARVAQKLVADHKDRVAAKLDLYDHLLQANSPLVKRNPLGWLRKAIEEDYQGQPKAYKVQQERQKDADREQIARELAQQQERDDQERLTELITHYHSLGHAEQQTLLEEARTRLNFLAPDKRRRMDVDSPILRAVLCTVIEERQAV